MLPTACFSIGNSRSPTGSTLPEASWGSESSTLFGSRAGPLGGLAPWALALVGTPRPDSGPSPEGPRTCATTTAMTAVAAAPTKVILLADRIGRQRPKSSSKIAGTIPRGLLILITGLGSMTVCCAAPHSLSRGNSRYIEVDGKLKIVGSRCGLGGARQNFRGNRAHDSLSQAEGLMFTSTTLASSSARRGV